MGTLTAVSVAVVGVAAGLDAGGNTPVNPVFLQQTFTGVPGTVLTALTPTIGGTWSAMTGYVPSSPSAIDTAGTALYAASSNASYQNSATPSTADYYVEAVFNAVTALAGDFYGIAGRINPTVQTYYMFRYAQAAAQWQLIKVVSGTSTTLGTFADTVNTGDSRIARLTMVGSTISGSVGGSVVVSVTDTAITAAGLAGMRTAMTQTGTTGAHCVSIVASN